MDGTEYRLTEDRAKAFLRAAAPLLAAFLFLTEYSREAAVKEKAHQLELRRQSEEYSRMNGQDSSTVPRLSGEDGNVETDGKGETSEPER
jgi:hypothetical protein